MNVFTSNEYNTEIENEPISENDLHYLANHKNKIRKHIICHDGFDYHKKYTGKEHTLYSCKSYRNKNSVCSAQIKVLNDGSAIESGAHDDSCYSIRKGLSLMHANNQNLPIQQIKNCAPKYSPLSKKR